MQLFYEQKPMCIKSIWPENKSALTDHASQDNHVINWPAATILDRESHTSTHWIKEAVRIWNEGWQSLNRDQGNYMLNHTCDWFLAMSHLYRGKNWKKNSQVHQNGWTNPDAVWVMGSDGPQESCYMGSRSARGGPLQSIATFCRDLSKNGWTDRDAVWVMD